MHPFHFLADARGIVSGPELKDLARRAEQTGYHGLVIPDHLIAQLGPVPAMAWIASATERLRVAAFVFNNDLRHPAVLAQDLASIDVLSGGRLDIAIGAGWNRPEYDAIGLSFDATPVRQARLIEGIAVLKGAFGDGPFSHHGEHYTIMDLDGYPKPVQRPHPPFRSVGEAGGPLNSPPARHRSSASRRGSCRAAARTHSPSPWPARPRRSGGSGRQRGIGSMTSS